MGCPDCDDRGYFRLTECPHKQLYDRNTSSLVRAAEWMKKGMPPVAGGTQDQSHWFMEWFEVWCTQVQKFSPTSEMV